VAIGVEGRPRVLAFAYAAEPGRGSEPGAGWGIVRAIARFADCVVLVGSEHIPAIRRWEAQHRPSGLSFVEVPEPQWGRYAKRHRATRFLVYLQWLRRAYDVGQRLHREAPFDLVHHITFAVYWLPTPAIRFGVPCVWGPVGGAVTTPRSLWPLLGWVGVFDEILDAVAVRTLALLPATRRTWRDSKVRLLQNEATAQRLPSGLHGSSVVLNHALLVEAPHATPHVCEPETRGKHVVTLGAIEARKGLSLVIRALAVTPPYVVLTVIGDGPERRRLERLARRLRVADRVSFVGWVPRGDAMRLLTSASAAVFAGLREEGGLALAEAMLLGVPVIVVANGGAATIAAHALDHTRVALIEPGNIDSATRRIGEAMTRFTRSPVAQSNRSPLLAQTEAQQMLVDAYAAALGTRNLARTSST
jgi:glycosyltransferase involved in cell wall biosynthesis